MFFNTGTWPSTINDPAEARDRYHRVALYEARIAAEHEPHRTAANGHRGLIDRLRTAFGVSPSSPDAITCSAC